MPERADATDGGILCFHGSLRGKGAKSELNKEKKEIPEGRGALNYKNNANVFQGSALQGVN